ncbi:MAG: RNA-binding transcriptional accessory protein, partial [Bacteroidaceae bacterium]|nr:RNA-binding transcriptional accessory protein [Bacteroidaceae bacterium]
MNSTFKTIISKSVGISETQVANTLELLEEGCTIPFISRYRKERTGALDEVKVAAISDQLDKLKETEKRKQTILSTIEEQGKLTDELRKRIENSWDATELEDIYMPFKPKRRTRAQVAREKGLEPLADFLLLQTAADVQKRAAQF